MSIVIKSNQVADKNFGNIRALSTTAQQEFDKYKARVVADGGVIKDEAVTLAAITKLFDTQMYGNCNTAISSKFGVKLDSGGKVTKIYAIDGVDLTANVKGAGVLPSIDTNGYFDFTANTANSKDAAIFSSPKKLMSKSGRFGFLATIKEISSSASNALSALSVHNDKTQTQPFMSFVTYTSGKVDWFIQPNPLELTTRNLVTPTYSLVCKTAGYPAVALLSKPDANACDVFRGSEGIVAPRAATAFLEIKTDEFYLDFGGAVEGSKNNAFCGRVESFYCFSSGTDEQINSLVSAM